jgi:hypothetical protein
MLGRLRRSGNTASAPSSGYAHPSTCGAIDQCDGELEGQALPTVMAHGVSAPRDDREAARFGFALSAEMGVETHSIWTVARGDSHSHRSA